MTDTTPKPFSIRDLPWRTIRVNLFERAEEEALCVDCRSDGAETPTLYRSQDVAICAACIQRIAGFNADIRAAWEVLRSGLTLPQWLAWKHLAHGKTAEEEETLRGQVAREGDSVRLRCLVAHELHGRDVTAAVREGWLHHQERADFVEYIDHAEEHGCPPPGGRL